MPKQSNIRKPRLGWAIIAKDAEQTIAACLDSIRPVAEQIVVCVDERTTDKTARVAKRHGAQIHPVKVSDWHECAQHGRVLAQHFAAARNASFSYLDQSLDWWCWIDSDDVFKGADKLADILDAVPPDHVGLWVPYHYATMKGGEYTNTLFHRERFLRPPVGWEWAYRVHEVVTPKRPGPWIMANDVAMYHQEGVHKTENSATRNLLCLEIDYEEDPRQSRTLFYLGNQYFAMGEWERAAYWYEQLGQLELDTNEPVNVYELWQARCYQAMAFQKMNNLNMAMQACFGAIDSQPEHPEPYFILASIYTTLGHPQKALYWTEHGRRMKEPPFFVFKNPLDYSFNNRLPMSDALARMGRVAEARQELEQAYAALPDENVAAGIQHYAKIEQEAAEAQRFKDWALATREYRGSEDTIIHAYTALSREVKGIQSVRDLVMPMIVSQRPDTQPSISFLATAGWEEWAPPKINETGLGGSETALVEIAYRFAQDGWKVDVFNNAGAYEGVYDGVGYWDARRGMARQPDIFVSWRIPPAFNHGKHNILWAHDLHYGVDPGTQAQVAKWDRILGVSEWHAKMLRNYYELPEQRVSFVPNGIDLSRFKRDMRKIPFQCVYASSADRGLLQLLHLWPRIVAEESTARLKIAYGWDTVDRMIEAGRSDLAQFKDAVMQKISETPQVEFLGRLPQDRLADLYSESWLWLYPTNFLEVSCISAMEAMAGGCVPVTSAAGALKETVGQAGVVVTGQPHSFPWQDFYVQCAKGALFDANVRKPLEYAARNRAQDLTWDKAYERWLEHVSVLMEGAKEGELVTA